MLEYQATMQHLLDISSRHMIPLFWLDKYYQRRQVLTINLAWIEGEALDSAHCQQELILWHAAEVHQAQTDCSLIVIQLKDTAHTQMVISNDMQHRHAAAQSIHAFLMSGQVMHQYARAGGD